MNDRATAGAVLISGGAAGLGRAIARGFLDRGAFVHVLDKDADALDALRREAGPELTGHAVDMGEPQAVEDAVASAGERLGGFRALINNVGIAGPTGPMESLDVAAWQACLNINLNSAFYALRAVLPAMKSAGAGAIVNIASTAGLYGYALRTPYAASKWALIGLTKSLALELGPHNIRVNAVCPGSIAGPRMDRVIAAEAVATGTSEASVRAGYAGQSAMGRFIDAEEIADTVLYLCSNAAARVNGQVIAVDGYSETAGSVPG